MDLDDVVLDVERRFQECRPPSWPDPHPGLASPLDEEYSRVTHPERYAIIWQRAKAWVDACTTLLGATWKTDPHAGIRCPANWYPMRLAGPGQHCLDIVVACPPQDSVEDGIIIAIADGDTLFEQVPIPFCGCDACDDGSRYLTDEVDSYFAPVVAGAVTRLESSDGYATRYGDSRTSSTGNFGGTESPTRASELLKAISLHQNPALPPGTRVRTGNSWL